MHSQDDQELDWKWPMVPPAAVQRKVTENPRKAKFLALKRRFESTHLPTSSDEEAVKRARLFPSRTSTPSQK